MSVFVKGMKMPMCCAECRFLVYADFEAFVECSALTAFMTKDKVPEGRREDCPLVDEENVKHGKWIFSPDDAEGVCTSCNFKIYGRPYNNTYLIVPYNFCPNCGADMRKEAEDGKSV